jgi:hypothetical protein
MTDLGSQIALGGAPDLGAFGEIWQHIIWQHLAAISAWIGLGIVILIPALAVRFTRRPHKQHGKHHAPGKAENLQFGLILHFVLVGMVYPAVLGSILYNLLPSLVENHLTLAHLPLIALEFAIITHYCYDYVYISTRYSKGVLRYPIDEYFVDVMVVLMLYLSASAVNITARKADLQEIGAIYCVLYAFYTFWDIRRRENWKITAGDAAFAIGYFLFLTLAHSVLALTYFAPLVLAAMILTGTSVLAVTSGELHAAAAAAGES